jgi:tRNA A-37 threonylcarbamoyl transferase component Bud32
MLCMEVAPNYAPYRDAIAALLAGFDAQGETLHRKRNTVKKMQLDDRAVVVKSFRVPGGVRAFVYGRLRKSKARRAYEYAQRLRAMGVDTPAPVAFVEQRSGGGLSASFFVSEYYPYDFAMSAVFPGTKDEPAPEEADAIIEAFTRITFDLHEAGVLHIDHNPSNTLVRRQAGGWDFAIIDINRMQFRALTLEQRMKNLVRLTDDVAAMRLMARTYAHLAGEKPERCEDLLMKLKRRHWRKLAFKKQVKKLLGRHPR